MHDLSFNEKTLEDEAEVHRARTAGEAGTEATGEEETDRRASESRGRAAIPRKYSSTVVGVAHSNNCSLVIFPESQERYNVLQEEEGVAIEKTRESSP